VSDEAIVALYRYFVRAHLMRVEAELARRQAIAELGPPSNWPSTSPYNDCVFKMWMYVDFWWSSLFMVVEGYEKLGLDWPKTEALLDSPLLPKLRAYRAGTFHYEEMFFNEERHSMGLPLNKDGRDTVMIWMTNLQDAIRDEIHAEINRRTALRSEMKR
jgi:hypothetical protein